MYEAVEISTDAGQTRRYENKGLATWTGHPDRDKVWFDLCGGDIVVKNPDEPTIEKMKSIADALDARVRRVDDRER